MLTSSDSCRSLAKCDHARVLFSQTQVCVLCACLGSWANYCSSLSRESGDDMVKNPAAGVLVALDRFDALSHLTPIKVGELNPFAALCVLNCISMPDGTRECQWYKRCGCTFSNRCTQRDCLQTYATVVCCEKHASHICSSIIYHLDFCDTVQ